MTINQTRAYAFNHARKIYHNGEAATWSEACVLGWKAAKLKAAIMNGKSISFVKVDCSIRTVANPALYSSTGKPKVNSKPRKKKFANFVFIDQDKLAKTGYGVISCKLANVLV